MAIIYSNANGWIVSHQDYFDKIRVVAVGNSQSDRNQNGTVTHHFKLNPALFDIWMPYKKHKCKLKDNEKHVDNQPPDNAFETPDQTDHPHIVQSLSHLLIQAARTKRLAFSQDHDTDKDNTCALQIAQDFYDRVESKEKEDSPTFMEFYGENNFEYDIQTELGGNTFIIPPRTKFHCRNIESIGMQLKEKLFDVIVMDPPWRNKYIRRRKRKQSEGGYQLLENCKIEEIPIATLTNDNALVLVWCTNCKAHQEQVVRKFFPKWGLQWIHKWYWLKATRKGEPITEFHDPESTLKQPFETILVGRKSSMSSAAADVAKISSMDQDEEEIKIIPKVIVSVPSSLHSHKPPLVDIIESQFGVDTEQLNCLELFARSLLPGWTSYGNQVLKLQSMHLYTPITSTEITE